VGFGEKGPVMAELTAFTIGHSNHPVEKLIDLLKQHEIDAVVDVRSSPYARYATHFNKKDIRRALEPEGIKYLFLGDAIGGRPKQEEFYDDEGHVLYGKLAQSPGFQQGVTRLLDEIRSHRVALLCGEEDPTDCHRRVLIGPVLVERGVKLIHIRGDGRAQTEEELAKEQEYQKSRGQMSLFEDEETKEWKSTQSVSPRKVPQTSSRLSNEPGSSV
jgi:uncharacterized protein (DUF488 family)